MFTSLKEFYKFRIYKAYLRLLHEHILVRRRYTLGLENLSAQGERYFIACNHQNTANDPLNIVFALPLKLNVYALARANVFSVHPLITRYLHWIGLLPAYRFGWEGGEGLEHNFQTFDDIAERVNAGFPVIVFPEAGHTQGHYLDPFTTGLVRMAFHAARANGFTEDIKILPTAHHYEDYVDMQTDFVWRIGEPISLKPYYEAYQQHPNSVMRNITRELRQRIHAMMLDEGKEDYEEKDFLRRSTLNPSTLQAMPLPQRMEADQRFIDALRSHPDYDEIINNARQLRAREQALGIDEHTIAAQPHWLSTLAWTVLLILLLPLYIVSLWPHGLCYAFPPMLMKTDKMFKNSYRTILSLVILYPLTAVLTFLVLGAVWGWWWQAVVWILLWIPTGRFAWWYHYRVRLVRRAFNYLRASRQELGEIAHLHTLIQSRIHTPHE